MEITKNKIDYILEKWNNKRYYTLNQYLKETFGAPVYKAGLNANLNCPNKDGKIDSKGCIYCNNESFSNSIKYKNLSVSQQLDLQIKELENKYKAKKYIAYFQSYTNTYAPVEKLEKLYNEVLQNKKITGIAIGTRPDCLPEDVIKLLEDINTKTHLWVELGLQSANDKILTKINRGHTVEDFIQSVNKLHNKNIDVCAHIILGLPDETKKSMLSSAKLLNELKIEGIKFHQLQITKGSQLEKIYLKNNIKCLSFEEYIELAAEYLSILSPDIVIHRMFGEAAINTSIAPLWDMSKPEMYHKLNKFLEKSNIWQGKFFDN